MLFAKGLKFKRAELGCVIRVTDQTGTIELGSRARGLGCRYPCASLSEAGGLGTGKADAQTDRMGCRRHAHANWFCGFFGNRRSKSFQSLISARSETNTSCTTAGISESGVEPTSLIAAKLIPIAKAVSQNRLRRGLQPSTSSCQCRSLQQHEKTLAFH